MQDDELQDLDQNFANYATRAKDVGIIVSSGPWGGYQLARTELSSAGMAGVQDTAMPCPRTGPVGTANEAQIFFWESFLHLPLTVAMSVHFSSRVVSLPNRTDNVRWGNPDMLMLRPSPLSRVQEFDPTLDPSAFRVVDASPECILASIEVKGGLDRDRAKLFTSIAEAAANSRWANEAWLVFTDWDVTEQGLDEDVVSLARSVEVGLLEVRMAPSAGDGDLSLLRTIVHHAAPTRSTLRIGELTRERVGVLLEAQSLLKLWASDQTTFLDVDRAEQKVRLLLGQALSNLRRQRGFTLEKPLSELVQQLRQDDTDYVDSVLQAALRSAAIAAGLDVESNLVAVVANAADNALIKREADVMRADLAAFGRKERFKESPTHVP